VRARFWKSSVRATKSVSQFSSTIAPRPPCVSAATTPSLVDLPARFSALAIPFLRRKSTAAAMSPLFSSRAFLQSIMPAPVRWRSSWTSLAVKVAGMLVVTLILAAAGRPGSVAWKRRRRGPAARLV
jgi:hypothetical protein